MQLPLAVLLALIAAVANAAPKSSQSPGYVAASLNHVRYSKNDLPKRPPKAWGLGVHGDHFHKQRNVTLFKRGNGGRFANWNSTGRNKNLRDYNLDGEFDGWREREGLYLDELLGPAPYPDVFVEPMPNMLTFYSMEIAIGTPQQSMSVLIDTGSSDLWVPTLESGALNGFDRLYSRTWEPEQGEEFEIKYVKGYANGVWGRDIIDFPRNSLSVINQRFAVALDSSDIDMGVFGIGPVNSESSGELYNNVPVTLAKQGYISKNLYSIYLDNWDAANGQIVFGGIDLAKFQPPLQTVPLLSTLSFKVALLSLTVDWEDVGRPAGVVLDTGTSLMYLPDDYVDAIAAAFNAHWEDNCGHYVITMNQFDCGPSEVTFNFDGISISVPKAELWWPLEWFADVPPTTDLALTVFSNDKSLGYNILGDTFLRSAYVVYDLDYRQVSIAQASCPGLFDDEEDIVPIHESVPNFCSFDDITDWKKRR